MGLKYFAMAARLPAFFIILKQKDLAMHRYIKFYSPFEK